MTDHWGNLRKKRIEQQRMYNCIAEELDGHKSEQFAMWLKGEKLETVFNLVKEWEESK